MIKQSRAKGVKKGVKKVQRRVKPVTKYKTGESKDYEGSCNQEQVQKCVDQGKYCNLDTNKCIQPKGVKTKIGKDKTLAVDPSYGVVGKTQAVNNIKRYLEKLSATEQKKLDIGIATEIVKDVPVVKKKAPKKSCTKKECEEQGKLCNKKTGNCIKDSTANRKKLGMPEKTSVKKIVETAKKKASIKAKAVKVEEKYGKMLVKDLKAELKKRGLKLAGKKADLVKRLKDDDKEEKEEEKDYSKMLVKDLRAELKKLGLPSSGKKADLVKRLKDDDKVMEEALRRAEEMSILPLILAEEVSPSPPLYSPPPIPEEEVKDYSKMLVKDLREELKKRGLTLGGEKADMIDRIYLYDDFKAEEAIQVSPPIYPPNVFFKTPEQEVEDVAVEEVEELPKEDCAEDGCETGEVCNVDTGKCGEPAAAKVKNYQMLSYNGGVYYGSKKALAKFAIQMGIDEPKIQTATKKKMREELIKSKKKVLPEVEEVLEEELPTVPELEEVDIAALIEEPAIEEEEVEDVEKVAEIIHEVSAEQPLTKQQQEMIEKIRKCIGI